MRRTGDSTDNIFKEVCYQEMRWKLNQDMWLRVLFICLFVCLGNIAAYLHADENDPIRGEKLMKKEKAGRIAGVKARRVREESILMHSKGMACS